MRIDVDEIERNIRRWHSVAPMTVVALIEELRRVERENDALKARIEACRCAKPLENKGD